MRKMHIWPHSISENRVWFSDQYVGGLYTYDDQSEKVYCKIKTDMLIYHGIYKIAALASWDRFVFVFSERVNEIHIVYDNLEGKIKKLYGLENERDSTIHKAIVIGEIMYLIPLEIKGYIYAIDLTIRNETDSSMRFVIKKIGENILMETWLPKSYDKSLYIPEYGGKRVFCITGSEIRSVDLNISSGLHTIGVYKNELWAAPLYGDNLFRLTLDGEVEDKIEIFSGNIMGNRSDIWEIIPRDKIVLFVHWLTPKIDVYHREKQKIVSIDGKMFEMPCDWSRGDELHYYLPYVIKKNVIRFFPSKCNMLEIDLIKLTYQQKELCFPTEILDEEWDDWRGKIRRYRYRKNNLFSERDEGRLEFFLEYVSEGFDLKMNINSRKNNIGGKIYRGI